MRLNRQQKVEIVKQLTQQLKNAKGVIILGYQGTKVAEMTSLRKQLKEKKIEMRVVKNSLLERALRARQLKLSPEILKVPLAVVISTDDEIEPAKMVVQARAEAETIQPLAGIFEGGVVDEKYILELARLPGREELLAKLAATIKAPISGFHAVLRFNLAGLINLLKAKANLS